MPQDFLDEHWLAVEIGSGQILKVSYAYDRPESGIFFLLAADPFVSAL